MVQEGTRDRPSREAKSDQNFTFGFDAGIISSREKKKEEWRNLGLQERLTHSLVKGIDKFIIEDVEFHYNGDGNNQTQTQNTTPSQRARHIVIHSY